MLPNLPGLQLRHPTANDIPQIVAFANQCAQMDLGIQQVNTIEQLAAFWHDPHLHPERDILLVVDGRDTIVASLTALIVPPYNHVYQELNIHPIYRRRGLEAFLLERAEGHAALALEFADDETPVTIVHGVHSRHQWLRELLDANGYTTDQSLTRLDIDLSTPPPIPTWPDAVTFKPYADAHAAALSTAIREINQDIGAAQPPTFEALLLHPSFDPAFVTVGWQGHTVAAVAVIFPVADDDPHSAQVAYVGVRRAWRGDNLGQSTLQIGLRSVVAQTQQRRAMVFANRQPQVEYFQRLGFSIAQVTLIYQKRVR